MAETPRTHPIVRVILNFLSEVWSFVLFSLFSAPVRGEQSGAKSRDTSVTSLEPKGRRVDTPLERSRPERHLGSRTQEGQDSGLEDDVSDEFLSQLEQRTQQVKITLANLEAEKIRIEGMIAQLQPIVPHYDALLQAERQISEANIALEGDGAGTEAEASTQDEMPPEPTDADHQPEDSGNSGWSGSWNS